MSGSLGHEPATDSGATVSQRARRRSAIVGHGRLLPMTGLRVGGTDVIEGPWVAVLADGRVAEVRAGGLRPGDPDDVDDVGGALVTPGLVDPHTHLVFAGDRSDEAAARSRGERYSGGGILRTVGATAAASDEDLVAATRARLLEAAASGTTTIEVKSGYGLTAAAELRLLRLIAEAAAPLRLRVLRTYLGAHAVPAGCTPREHAEAVIAALPDVAPAADFVDVFCEPGIFDLELTRRILEAGRRHGLGLRLHAEQLEHSGGARLGVALGALSVDHLEHADEDDARALAASDTVATILPGPALMLRGGMPPVRPSSRLGRRWPSAATPTPAPSARHPCRSPSASRWHLVSPSTRRSGRPRSAAPGRSGSTGDPRGRRASPSAWTAAWACWNRVPPPTWWPGTPRTRATSRSAWGA